MEHDEFIGQVQNRARLGTRGDAERATRATLETLGDRLSAGSAENLAGQLPHEIGEHLRRTAGQVGETGERFSLEDFFELVREREGGGVETPEAVFHARAVVEVVDDATTPGVIDKVRGELPDDYGRLFEAGSTGQMAAGR